MKIFNFQFSIFNKKGIQTGFTILELLVVIAIIGMIASFVIVQLTGFRAKSRDASREQAIKEIQNALELYHTTHLRFPVCAKIVIDGLADCLSSQLIADGEFTSVPKDPLGGAGGTAFDCKDPPNVSGVHVFCFESELSNGADYTLWWNLETNEIDGRNEGWQRVSP